MKFCRYGSLDPQKAVRWRCDLPGAPARYGIYALPYGYLDYFFIWRGRGCDASPRVQYLTDDKGDRLLYRDVFPENPLRNAPESDEIGNPFGPWMAEIEETSPYLATWQAKWRKLEWDRFVNQKHVRRLKEHYHIRDAGDILEEPRTSWIMVMDDPRNPPRLTHNPSDPSLTPEQVESIPLNQKLRYLKWENGERVSSVDLLKNLEWDHSRYWNAWRPLGWGEVRGKEFLSEATKRTMNSSMQRIYARLAGRGDASREEAACKQAIRRWLAGKGLRLEQLCPWPVYEKGRGSWAAYYKRPHLFDFSGCLWHHLGMHVKSGEIIRMLDDYQGEDPWVYTTIGAYEAALLKASPFGFPRAQAHLKKHGDAGSRASISDRCYMYHNFEVFIEGKLTERKQN